MSQLSSYSPDCPFCAIASSHPPYPPSTTTHNYSEQDDNVSKTHVILSTKNVLAFLDIMPLTKGHVLVIPRQHYRNLGAVDVKQGKEVGDIHFLVEWRLLDVGLFMQGAGIILGKFRETRLMI